MTSRQPVDVVFLQKGHEHWPPRAIRPRNDQRHDLAGIHHLRPSRLVRIGRRRRPRIAKNVGDERRPLLVLEALSCVDTVVAFDTDTPEPLIEAVRPDVFAKGGDYTRETLPEAELVERLGGTVQILPLVDDRSTTGIIDRARTSEPVAVR